MVHCACYARVRIVDIRRAAVYVIRRDPDAKNRNVDIPRTSRENCDPHPSWAIFNARHSCKYTSLREIFKLKLYFSEKTSRIVIRVAGNNNVLCNTSCPCEWGLWKSQRGINCLTRPHRNSLQRRQLKAPDKDPCYDYEHWISTWSIHNLSEFRTGKDATLLDIACAAITAKLQLTAKTKQKPKYISFFFVFRQTVHGCLSMVVDLRIVLGTPGVHAFRFPKQGLCQRTKKSEDVSRFLPLAVKVPGVFKSFKSFDTSSAVKLAVKSTEFRIDIRQNRAICT